MAGAPNPTAESRIAAGVDEGPGRAGSGLPVDRSGGPTVDPTKNVLDLTRAESKYQDYAREQEAKRQDNLRDAEITRLDQLHKAESQLQHTINEHQVLANKAETRRLDDLAALRQQYEVRAADSLALQVKTTSDLISTQLDKVTNSLSQQIRDGNEGFSSQVRTMAETLSARITDLEKFRWEVGGKTSVQDPATAAAMVKMAATVEALAAAKSTGDGTRTGQANVIAYIAVAVSIAVGFIAVYNFATPG